MISLPGQSDKKYSSTKKQTLVMLSTLLLMFTFSGYSQAANKSTANKQFVGSEQCIDCHQEQYQAWQGSHHDMAMKHATDESVLGDFNNVTFVFDEKENRFYKKGDQFWVYIEGPDQKFHHYQIKYTFGFEPLQQYMVEFDDGRVQLIPFTWDSRKKEDGGQRWYNLYPQFNQSHQDFFWTNTGQNWNYMCADCHSTNLQKNFDTKTNTFNSTWSEINVACEACHGPAADHLKWVNAQENNDSTEHLGANLGFKRSLAKAVASWEHDPKSTTLVPGEKVDSQQVLVCAQCHSRHTQISNDDHVASGEFGDRYLLSLLEPNLYYADGQIYDEDYVYGSFLQSKMAQAGVVCSNCHDPHTAKLKMPQEAVCLQCHQAPTYNNETHHHHKEGSEGAQCVNCHMPETTYMQVDPRRDHNWHTPNPVLEQQIGSPDVCVDCHQKTDPSKDRTWSKQVHEKWFGVKQLEQPHPATTFFAADRGYQGAADALSHIAQNYQFSNIVRASALMRTSNTPNRNTLVAIARGVKHQDSYIRLGAIDGAQNFPPKERWEILALLLDDKVLAVRTEAARTLAPIWSELNKNQQDKLQPILDEYLSIQEFNGDRGASHSNISNIAIYQGRFEDAEKALKNAIRIEPHFSGGYLNLADLYRRQQKSAEAIKTLKQGQLAQPDDGNIPYSLGLAFIRQKQSAQAITYFKQAVAIEPQNARFHYVLGLTIQETDQKVAQSSLRQAYELSNNPQYLYALCELQVNIKAFQAEKCIAELTPLVPKEVIDKLKR
ncbi:tetratricopeptide repeat protein [Thalassotalea atypica]|uniref:tetratricopeptide repeat protein n=1 Tax=Thalassotalea atypica TaxID=2054316 RepID=UPI0025723E0B|nr:tetratricopeptide repeat protein [Thalassotalea atypica]